MSIPSAFALAALATLGTATFASTTALAHGGPERLHAAAHGGAERARVAGHGGVERAHANGPIKRAGCGPEGCVAHAGGPNLHIGRPHSVGPCEVRCGERVGDHDHDRDRDRDDHDHDHAWKWNHLHANWSVGWGWHRLHWGEPAVVDTSVTPVVHDVAAASPAVSAGATTTAGNCNCLTKQYLNDGSVLFKDVCTKEAALATPDELKAQAQGAPLQAH